LTPISACGAATLNPSANPENLKNMETARQLLETYLDAISAGEMEKAIALFADDGAIEFPYFGSVNLPTRYQGRRL
jgi:ketosteroid isomerase-like protein